MHGLGNLRQRCLDGLDLFIGNGHVKIGAAATGCRATHVWCTQVRPAGVGLCESQHVEQNAFTTVAKLSGHGPLQHHSRPVSLGGSLVI
jgi:hypothetical protein